MEIPIKKSMAFNGTRKVSPVGYGSRAINFGQGGSSVSPSGVSSGERVGAKDTLSENIAMKIVNFVVKASIYGVIFLLPLFFVSSVPNPGVLELNKQFLLVAVVGIGFLAWVGKMAWKNEIRFKKNFILVPVITFLVIYGISSAFSLYADQSIWGYFGGESKSFISLLFLVALFLLISNNIKSRKEAIRVIMTFLVGGFIVALYGVLQIWGKHVLPAAATKSVYFNTVGSAYVFGVYIAALLLMSLALFMDNVSKVTKIVLICLSFFFFFILIVVNFKIIWIALLVSLALLLGAAIIKSGSTQNQARILPMVFLVLALLMVLRKTPVIRKEMPVEVLLNYKTSLGIAFGSWKDNPMLGIGPGMFVNVYEKFRPANLGDFWAVNFNDATSYFLTLMSTVGILGTASFLFLVGVGLLYLFRGMSKAVAAKQETDFMIIGTGVVWLFTTIILFTYLSSMTIMWLWWFSFALFVSFIFFDPATKAKEFVTSSQSPRSSLSLSFVFVLVIIGFITAIYMQSQKYVAAIYFNRALVADEKGEEITSVEEKIRKAIEADPGKDLYYRNLSVALFALANKRVAEKGQDLSPEDSNYVSSMIKGALQSADQAIKINPSDPANYASLAGVYEGVLATMDQADERAIENYEKAIELDPLNPVLYQKIAGIYVTLSDIEIMNAQQKQKEATAKFELPEESKKYLALARENLQKALDIKKDYADANLLLASVYEREGNISGAIEKEKENRGIYPSAPGIAFRLGLLYYKNEQLDEAKKEFEAATVMDKNYSNARYFLGLIHDKQKDKKAAIEQFEKVAELNPENEDIKKILENLKAGKEALAGLDKSNQQQAPVEADVPSANEEDQTNINPEVNNQEIPEQAVPSPEEVKQDQDN